MSNDKNDFTFRDYPAYALVVGTFAFAGFQLTRLGAEWTVEGVRYVKSKRNKNV